MNRTHRGRDTPPIGFEGRERHQATDYSLIKQVNSIYQPNVMDSSRFVESVVFKVE